jgi:hypothetical protein
LFYYIRLHPPPHPLRLRPNASMETGLEDRSHKEKCLENGAYAFSVLDFGCNTCVTF